MSAHHRQPATYVFPPEVFSLIVDRDPGDYEGLHRARITGPNAHQCEPWMLTPTPTIGSYCRACCRRWP
ncbi:hypothetical protein, partial [Mycolicibacterium canariasense]|uniref:hypothetical protein n=1 Tax=Mycolicibacterium canariasense TaxID=228230 RepID=UPI001A9899CD